jgi:benzoate transport
MTGRTRWTAIQALIVGLCFALNMLDGTDLLVMSFVAPVLSVDWSVSPEKLGVLFSASLFGMAIGCLGVAPLADRFGRRPLLLGALCITSVSMMLSAYAANVSTLMVIRLFVGIGVGTIGVTMTTMAAEYAPPRYAHFAVGFVQAGWPFGSVLTAVAAAQILPGHRWQVLFLGIAVLSFALLLVIAVVLPESMLFLTIRRPPRALERVNEIRRRLHLGTLDALPEQPVGRVGFDLKALFLGGRRVQSVLLWCAVTLGYFDLYFVISWIPKLATQAGLPISQAIYAGATYNIGAFFGTSAVGWIATRLRLDLVVAGYFVCAAVAMLIFGGVAMPVWLTLVMAFLVGVTVQGGFNGFWAIAARLYPSEIRSTGVGWALGVGRVGAVLGPIVGGILVGAGLPIAAIFAVFAVPLLAASLMTARLNLK